MTEVTLADDCDCECERIESRALCEPEPEYVRGPLIRRCDRHQPAVGPLLRDHPAWRGPSGDTHPAHAAQHLAGQSIRLWPAGALDLWADYGNVAISDLDGTEPAAIVTAESVTTGPIRRPLDTSWLQMEKIRG